MESSPRWVTAFFDFAAEHFETGVAYWSAITEYDVSPSRGDAAEFASLVPHSGDEYLRLQRLAAGSDRVHLDLHVADARAAADRAVALGAREEADHGYVVLTSPAGLSFCFVTHSGAVRPDPVTWPAGHHSLLDQVCLDIPASAYDLECGFWAGLTGWSHRLIGDPAGEFSYLERPGGQPLRILFQRLSGSEEKAGIHVDYSTSDRAAEVGRHVALGAVVEGSHAWWTVLADPVGRRYCVIDRDPQTGMLNPPAGQ